MVKLATVAARITTAHRGRRASTVFFIFLFHDLWKTADQHAAARLLVHSGANVCLPDARGLTCLRLTVEMADAPTVALLLAAEPPADLSVKDEVQSVHHQ